jgi:hypothetical protein
MEPLPTVAGCLLNGSMVQNMGSSKDVPYKHSFGGFINILMPSHTLKSSL